MNISRGKAGRRLQVGRQTDGVSLDGAGGAMGGPLGDLLWLPDAPSAVMAALGREGRASVVQPGGSGAACKGRGE
jgi:hypothetical protein